MKLARAADGKLRSAAAGNDIGDIWAEQRRIRLKEAIGEDQRKAAKKGKWRQLFKKNLEIIPPPTPSQPKGQQASKVVEIKISLPSKLNLPKFPKPRLPKYRLPRVSKKVLLVVVCVAVVAAAAYGGSRFFWRDSDEVVKKKPAPFSSETLGASQAGPQYDTVLPAGKTIEELGGWGRVTPINKEPVFAYVDYINGVQINVSQQPLPVDFKTDLAGQLGKLAEQFSANEKIMAGATVVYVGTSLEGSQSAILAKNNLLILIKSATKLTTEQWAQYVESLH
jgi:hypothetical protein